MSRSWDMRRQSSCYKKRFLTIRDAESLTKHQKIILCTKCREWNKSCYSKPILSQADNFIVLNLVFKIGNSGLFLFISSLESLAIDNWEHNSGTQYLSFILCSISYWCFTLWKLGDTHFCFFSTSIREEFAPVHSEGPTGKSGSFP